MKKFLLSFLIIFSAILLTSCRNESTIENQNNKVDVNPPSWIKGNWKFNFSGINQTYKFTNNDIIITSAGMSTNVKPIADLGGYSQTSSESEFSFSYNLPNYSLTYQFKKVSANKILCDAGIGGKDYDSWFEYIRE